MASISPFAVTWCEGGGGDWGGLGRGGGALLAVGHPLYMTASTLYITHSLLHTNRSHPQYTLTPPPESPLAYGPFAPVYHPFTPAYQPLTPPAHLDTLLVVGHLHRRALLHMTHPSLYITQHTLTLCWLWGTFTEEPSCIWRCKATIVAVWQMTPMSVPLQPDKTTATCITTSRQQSCAEK